MTPHGYIKRSDFIRVDNLLKLAAELEETAKHISCPELCGAFNNMARLVRESAYIVEEFLDRTSKYEVIRTVEID